MKKAYITTLVDWLGEEGQAVAEWLDENTTDVEFFEQPMNVYQQDRLLIEHAIGMLDKLTKLSKTFFSVQQDGVWIYKSPYSQKDYARVALYHILGSINKFRKEKRNRKDENGRWQEVIVWAYNEDRITYGTDGEQAILVLKDIWAEKGLFPLSREVEVAILNIGGIWDNPLRGGVYPAIYNQNQLALLAHLADTADNFYKGVAA